MICFLSSPLSRMTALSIIFASSFLGASAQTLTIRLLDGKTGNPIAEKNITVLWTPGASAGVVVRLGKDGTGQISIPAGGNSFSLMEGPRDGKEPNRVAYLDCNRPGVQQVSIADVMQKGLVPMNDCSRKTAIAKPGEVIFWARMKPWYVPDMQ